MKPTLAQLSLTLILIGGLLGACQRLPAKIEAAPASADAAQRAEADNEFVLAAHEYQRLADATGAPQKQYFEIKAVESLAKAGQVREARQRLAKLDVGGLDANLVARKHIVEARIATLIGEPEQTIQLLRQAEQARNVDPALLAEIYQVRSQAEADLDRPLDAVKSLIEREKHLVVKADLSQNQQQLWQLLQSQGRAALNAALHASHDAPLRGWLELALTVDTTGDTARTAAAIEAWKKTYPGHPAGEFVKTLAAPARLAMGLGRIERIALLLPLSSEHALAAQAVRDGFQAMHAASTRPDKPTVQIYDIGANPAQAPISYQAAVREGAQLVVGPLGLEAADLLVKQGALEVPTLLLSHTSQSVGAVGRPLFQFGLPPEQEAVQAAERAYLDGHRQAAVLTPESVWGQRLAKAFTDAWLRLGGRVVDGQTYALGQSDYAAPVKRLLNIAQSEARKDALETRLRIKIKFEARPRDDVDFIFLGADAKHARLIKPQISYHRAARLPVYATSHVFTGRGDPGLDADLDGIVFGDMPWILVGDGKIAQLRAALQRDWPYARSPLDRLYALGVDAYAILPWLNRIGADGGARFNGVTSGLSLERDGRLHRQLVWAKFKKGVPQLLDTFLKHKGQYEADDSAEDPFAFSPGT